MLTCLRAHLTHILKFSQETSASWSFCKAPEMVLCADCNRLTVSRRTLERVATPETYESDDLDLCLCTSYTYPEVFTGNISNLAILQGA